MDGQMDGQTEPISLSPFFLEKAGDKGKKIKMEKIAPSGV
jgi:hypothetical protein